MLKKKILCFILTVIAFQLVVTNTLNLNVRQVAAQTNPLVYIDPANITGLPPSTSFNIKIRVANATNLYGFDIQLKWDKTILEYKNHSVRVPVETYPDGVLHEPFMTLKNKVNESDSIPGADPGVMAWFGDSSMAPAEAFDGSGTMVEMTFRVRGTGRCKIEIMESALSNEEGYPVAHDRQDASFNNAPPPSPVDIQTYPPSVVDSTLTPCHNFSVDVRVFAVVNLYSFEFWVDYNSTLLNATEVTVNPLFTIPDVQILQDQGKVRINGTVGPIPSGYSGDLTLATITFHVMDIGQTALDLHDVRLVDKYDQNVPIHETGDGYFNNMLITRMFVSPPELIEPTMKPGDVFSIDIKLENAVGMYDYEFTLSYDTTVLNGLGVVVMPPSNDTNFINELKVNDTQGLVWVKVQYHSPAPPITIYAAETVTRIFFQVQSYGQTVLDLHDTRISDPIGNPMSHAEEDGFFATLRRDVAITSVNVTSPNKVYPGRMVTIEVYAMNRGNMTVETFNVTLHYDNETMETRTITLNPWTMVLLTFHWNTTGMEPCHNHTIWAEASQVPYEADPTDNVRYDGWVKIKYLGDVNGDGMIDLYDAVILLTAYGSHEGDPNYNSEADLAPAWGVIDLYDAVTLMSRYGLGCGGP
jgi:hypothetical protein